MPVAIHAAPPPRGRSRLPELVHAKAAKFSTWQSCRPGRPCTARSPDYVACAPGPEKSLTRCRPTAYGRWHPHLSAAADKTLRHGARTQHPGARRLANGPSALTVPRIELCRPRGVFLHTTLRTRRARQTRALWRNPTRPVINGSASRRRRRGVSQKTSRRRSLGAHSCGFSRTNELAPSSGIEPTFRRAQEVAKRFKTAYLTASAGPSPYR